MGRRSRKEILGKVVALPRGGGGKGLEDTEGRMCGKEKRGGGRERGRKRDKNAVGGKRRRGFLNHLYEAAEARGGGGGMRNRREAAGLWYMCSQVLL